MNRRQLIKSLLALPIIPTCLRAAAEDADDIAAAKAALAEPTGTVTYTSMHIDFPQTATLRPGDKVAPKGEWEVFMYSPRSSIRLYKS